MAALGRAVGRPGTHHRRADDQIGPHPKGEGLSLGVSEQNLHFCQAVADRADLFEKGQIGFGGTMAQLVGDACLREQYLAV